DEAQYSLPFPVATALIFGRVGAAEIGAPGLSDPRVARLLATFSLTEDDEFSRRFPAERWARVRIGLADGRSLVSEPAQACGGAEHPLSDEEITAKYREMAEPVLGSRRSSRIAVLAAALPGDATALPALIDELLSPTT
ncbi:MAG TPA: MmgE/PrpD family protein, partial [Casimicrobiaceae bacterium]|nr:MmgE/PrpD family protein [Casimicrobiaceae bacterium]